MPASSTTERTRRRRQLLELLARGAAGTQDEIARALGRKGFRVTQATVSRDLDELGAVRRRRGNRTVYVLPDQNGPPAGLGLRVFEESVVSVLASGNLVVVRTYPGMAPSVGAVIDAHDVDGVIGTVAGDDTVLVVAAEGTSGATLARRIAALRRTT